MPSLGFRRQDWLQSWWKLFSAHKTQGRDYWFPEVLSFEQNMLGDQPITYERGLKCFKYALSQALRLAPVSQVDIGMPAKDMIAILEKVTWHTCRVTLLSAAVHEQKDAQAIALQANWKNPSSLVLKYARDRRSIPLRMVGELVQALKQDWQPPIELEGSGDAPREFSDDEEVLGQRSDQFYVKKAEVGSCGRRIMAMKFHVLDARDSAVLACGRLALDRCEPAGSILPDISVLCKDCLSRDQRSQTIDDLSKFARAQQRLRWH